MNKNIFCILHSTLVKILRIKLPVWDENIFGPLHTAEWNLLANSEYVFAW